MLIYLSNRDPGVAQMVARLNGVQEAASSNLVTRTSKTQSVRKSTLRFCFYLAIGKNKTQSIIKTLCVSVCRLKEAPDGNDQYSRPNLR